MLVLRGLHRVDLPFRNDYRIRFSIMHAGGRQKKKRKTNKYTAVREEGRQRKADKERRRERDKRETESERQRQRESDT